MTCRQNQPACNGSLIAQNRSDISRLVENEVDNVIRDGRLRDGYAIIDEAVNRPEIAAIDNEVDRIKAIQDYYNTEHTDTHSRNVGYGKDYATRAVFQRVNLAPLANRFRLSLTTSWAALCDSLCHSSEHLGRSKRSSSRWPRPTCWLKLSTEPEDW